MAPPAATMLEQALAGHGDLLFRAALELTGDETRAARALRAMARQAALATPPPLDAPGLLALLTATVRAQSGSPATGAPATRPHRPASRRTSALAASNLARAIQELPLDQRQALVLLLLLGYDAERAALIAGTDAAAVNASLSAALPALARPASVTLPASLPTNDCPPARQALMAAHDHTPRSAAVRGHLATCSACRAFDIAWSDLTRRVEADMRDRVRDRTLPPHLAEALRRDLQPDGGWRANPVLRFVLLPLAVLIFIGALVLPGFVQTSNEPMIADAPPLADPYALVEQALAQHDRPPPGNGVWHARWEIIWFFTDGSYAPLQGDAWLDAANPARHRLQLVHSSGGGPYELQLSDGNNRLWYALDPLYYGSLYGSASTIIRPRLNHWAMSATEQEQARAERLRAGAWDIGPAYLRQAANARDLRTLGRQRDGRRTVDIVSFSGISPLAQPPDAPATDAAPITILLALDSADGRLRSATELIGPAGSAQISRTTWRLYHEEWLRDQAQIDQMLSIEQAWTGQGRFASEPRERSGDPALLMVGAAARTSPAALLIESSITFWLPNAPPPGVERALLYWEHAGPQSSSSEPLLRLTYMGTGRWLTVSTGSSPFDRFSPDDQPLDIGAWSARLSSGRSQRYRLALDRRANSVGMAPERWMQEEGANRVVIDAQGYSRAELVALVEGLRPFDLQSFNAQAALFAPEPGIAPEAHAALLAALAQSRPPGDDEALYRREQIYWRHNPAPDFRTDPYHRPRYGGATETAINEQWIYALSPGEQYSSFWRTRDADGAISGLAFADTARRWWYEPRSDTLEIWLNPSGINSWHTEGDRTALEMLARPGAGMMLTMRPDGSRVVTHRQPGREARRYQHLYDVAPFNEILPYLRDLQPQIIATELVLTTDSRPVKVRVYGEEATQQPAPPPVLLSAWELLAEKRVSRADALAEAQDGAPPAAEVVRDFTRQSNFSFSTLNLRALTPDEAQAQLQSPLLLLPESATIALEQIVGTQAPTALNPFPLDPLEEIVRSGLAVRLEYRINTTPSGLWQLRLLQGPVEPLRTFFQRQSKALWTLSSPYTLTLAGRKIDAWLMQDPALQRWWLFAEFEGALLIVEGAGDWFRETALPLLAELQPAS